ncbi:Ig domain-containing protein [Shewanella surugensis]|uniref:Ig domain-containing protein n=1 Tax=Shewanella surugensis TaxID=212020 RepID=A0ABT0LAY5_9GAMM|nr:Ig domain-containing protein [Shewanella surugensis]MCL1124862.1 putative Ig domain-containing protein [Shewanella surugensis]
MKHLSKLALLTLLSAQYSHAQAPIPQFETHTLSESQQKNQQRQIQLGEVTTWHSGTINALDDLSSSGTKVLGWDNNQDYIALLSTESATPTLLTEINLNTLGNEYSNIRQVELINEGKQVLIWGDVKIDIEDNNYHTEARLSLFSFNDTFNLIEDHFLKLNNDYSSMKLFNEHIFLTSYYNNTFLYIDNNKLIESGTINDNLLPNNISSACTDKTNNHLFFAGNGYSWDNRPALSVFKMDEASHQLTHKISYNNDDSYHVICESSNNVLIQTGYDLTSLNYNITDNTLTEQWQVHTYNELGDYYDIRDAVIHNNTLYFNERSYNPNSNITSFTINDTGLTLIENSNIYSDNYGNPASLHSLTFHNNELVGLIFELDALFISQINGNATINSTQLLTDGKQNVPYLSSVEHSLLSADGKQLFLLDENKNNLLLLIKDDNQAFIHAETIDLSSLSNNDDLYNSQLILTNDNQLIIVSQSSYMVFTVNEQNTLSFIHQENYSGTDNHYLRTSKAKFNQENNVLMTFDYNALYFFKLNDQSRFELITLIEDEDENDYFYNERLSTLGQYFYINNDDLLTTFSYDAALNTVAKTAKMAIPYGTQDILLTENNVYLFNYNSRTMQAYAKQDNGELTLLSLSPVEENDRNFTLMSPYLAASLNNDTDNIDFYHINPTTGIWSESAEAMPLPSKNSLDFIPSNNHFLKHINLLQDDNAIKEIYQLPVKRAPLIRSQKDKYTFLTGSNITLDLSSLFIEEDIDDTLTFSVKDLPQGLSLNEHNHVVGVVTQATSGFLTITATDKDELTTDLTLEYDIKAPAFEQSTTTVIMVNPNQAISLDLVAHFFGEDSTLAPSEMTFTLLTSETISDGNTTANTLTLTENGLLTGTLVDAGVHSIMIAVTLDEGIQNVLTLDMHVNAAPTVLENNAFKFSSNEAISIDLNNVFSDPEDSRLTFETSSLPSGLTLSDTGIISGSVNQNGHYSFTVQAIDEMALSTNTNISLDIESDDDSGGALGFVSLLLLSLFGYSRKK